MAVETRGEGFPTGCEYEAKRFDHPAPKINLGKVIDVDSTTAAQQRAYLHHVNKHFLCSGDRSIDIGVGVSGGNEQRFELTARHVDTAIDHAPEVF